MTGTIGVAVTAAAGMTGGMTMTVAEGPVEKALFRTVVLAVALAITCVGLLIAVIALSKSSSASDASAKAQVASAKAQQASEDAAKEAQSSCRFYRDLAELPLSDTSGQASFTIIADSRVAYAGLGCMVLNGPLPAPDPRVVPYLAPGTH